MPSGTATTIAEANERDRLAALRALEIVGTAADPHFDAVCSLAKTFFNVPTVLISLIEDDYQWFKSRCGFEPTQTSRSVSFCGHVILDDHVIVVEDATKDARFVANPLVTGEPFIRFYAGAPLTLTPGVRVGTICIIDVVPRRLSKDDMHKLAEFASLIVALLQLHEANLKQRQELVEKTASEAFAVLQAEKLEARDAALRETNRLLLLAEEIAHMGHWRIELPSRRRVWSPQVYRIFGQDPSCSLPVLDETFSAYHHEDRDQVRAVVMAAVADQRPFSLNARICRPDGSTGHVEVRGLCENGANQRVHCLFGVIIDVTEQKQVEEQLRVRERDLTAVLDNMPAIIGYLDKDLRIRLANRKYQDWFGRVPDEIKGWHVRDLIGQEHYQNNLPHMEAALLGHRQQFERRMSADRYVMASYIPDVQDGTVHGFFSLIIDITERKLAEDRLRASKAFQERVGRIAGIGAWELDLASGVVTFSDETRRIHDIEGTKDLSQEDALRFYKPEARLAIEQAIEDCIRTGKAWDLELPLLTAKGRSIWVRTAGEVEFVDGQPVRLVGVFQDVTSRQSVESVIREKEMQYRLLAENSSDMIVRIDLTGKRLFVSPSSEDLIGYKPHELIGTRARDRVHPEDLSYFEAMQAALVAGTKDQASITNRLLHKNGKYVWVEAKWRVLRDPAGQPTEFVASVRDVSSRREAEDRLQTSETLYRTLADSLAQMVWIVRATDRMAIYANKQYQDYYGPIDGSRDERVSRNHPDDIKRMEETFKTASAEGCIFEVEGRLRRHDGVYRWHKLVSTPIRHDGEIVEWVGTALDIDDIISGRQRLKETSDLLGLSQEAAGAGFFDLNLVTGKVVLSRESVAMHGLEGDDELQTDLATWRACVNPDDVSHVLALVDRACIDRTTYSAEFRVMLGGGRIRWIHGMGRAQYDHTGRALRMIGLNFDITERKASEAKLIEAITAAEVAQREAEQASAAKTDFLASMSHEIRTPLNSIIGYTDLLLDEGRHDSRNRRKLELIRDSGAALLTIVNDILDFSKIEAGEIDLDPNPFSLNELIENVLSIISGSAGETALAIDREVDIGIPAFVHGDAGRLRQILLNLMNNAVKFTREGSVRLDVVREASPNDVCRLRFTVTDTGIGIPLDRIERLFQRFSQIDGSINRRFGGTGLGLAISKSLVERMGGEIGVESVEGAGSSFWFTVAMPVAQNGPKDSVAAHGTAVGGSARILLVEDVIVNQDLARVILEANGHKVEVASDGAEAIRILRDGDFDLVLMDVQMPGMDGLTATRHIRALGTARASIPIVAMTANVLPQQIAAFKAAGMDDHIGKPFKRAELYSAVTRWAKRDDSRQSELVTATIDNNILDELRQMVGDAVCDKLVRKFASEMKQRFADIHADFERDRLANDAHAMISSAGSLGFTGFSNLCREVESISRGGGDLKASIVALQTARGAILHQLSELL